MAAAAVFETFPEVALLGGQETPMGFFCDFQFPHLIHPEMIAMIEQAMRQIARERREIRVLEMVPFSAQELLKAQGHPFRAAELDDPAEQFVKVVQMGSFYDLISGNLLKNSHQLHAFKLEKMIRLENGVTRLSGFAYPSKEDLNLFLKKLKKYPAKRHETQGEAQGLWKIVSGEIIWLNKGLKLREKLLHFFEKQALENFERISASSPFNRQELLAQIDRPVMEFLYSQNYTLNPLAGLYENQGTEIRIFIKDPISLLQSIEKTLNILGLEYNGQFCVDDALGRSWPVVEVRKGSRSVIVSIWIETILALLLEKYELLERLAIENQ